MIVAGFLYRHKKTKKEAIIALAAGTLTMVVVMYFANLVITPMFTGWPVTAVKELMPFILTFNAVKAGLNSIVTFCCTREFRDFCTGNKSTLDKSRKIIDRRIIKITPAFRGTGVLCCL